jgi:nucleotide-binding universal stress UspA family protein
MLRNILVPVDGSEHADKAVGFAADLASKYGAKLHLLQVLLSGHVPENIRNLSAVEGREEPPLVVGAAFVDASLPLPVLEDIAMKLLERARKTAGEHGADEIEATWIGGPAPERILEHARAIDADAIVMGARGLSRWSGLMVGSVSQKVQHVFEGRVITVK